ncbi:MAG TPA: hypothetical protein VGO96_05165, partial [Pyrinomonadaceae bacterium]|nr:hypothetical protein [Pyrinomonadaceae bacterium]
MKRFNRAIFGVVAFALILGANVAQAARLDDGDTDGRLVNVRIVEVSDERISVVTAEGVEHVISVCQINTQVRRGKQYVHCKDLRVDDVVTIVLDEDKPVKFAKNIEVREMVAENKP